MRVGALVLLGVGSWRGVGETTADGIGVDVATDAGLQPHAIANNSISVSTRASVIVSFPHRGFLPLEVIFRPMGEK